MTASQHRELIATESVESVTACEQAQDLVKHPVVLHATHYAESWIAIEIDLSLLQGTIMKLYLAAIVVAVLASTAIVNACVLHPAAHKTMLVSLFMAK